MRLRAAVVVASLLVSGAGVQYLARYDTPLAKATLIAKSESSIGFALHGPSKALFVVEQDGRLRPLLTDSLGAAALDLSASISTGGERGFLGAVFSNDGTWLYTDHTNKSGSTEITAWPFEDGHAITTGRRLLLRVSQPFPNHNGGHLAIDHAGVLWIGMGDGGSGGDPGNRAQNRKVLLGKILRIIPTPLAKKPYAIPSGNLAASEGRREIWAVGVRNPWTFQLDEAHGRIWIADVGQNAWEEIDTIPLTTSSANFGWPHHEGRHAYQGRSRIAGAIEPVFDYAHGSKLDQGCSITGGVVIASGEYLFTDYCTGAVRAITPAGDVRTYVDEPITSPTGFGLDANGTVYVASNGDGVYRVAIGT